MIDGSKAIRSAIEELYGEQGFVQRCRAHKVRNVTERLPEPVRSQVKAVMHAAYKLQEKEGTAKLRQAGEVARYGYGIPGRGSESAGGTGGNLHGESAQTRAGPDALPVHHEHH